MKYKGSTCLRKYKGKPYKNTKETLIDFAESRLNDKELLTDENLSELLKLVGAMPEYQRA